MSELIIPTERDGVFLRELGRGSALFSEQVTQPHGRRRPVKIDSLVWDHETFVGEMGLHFFGRRWDLGVVNYEITRKHRQKGYGIAALEAISSYAFNELDVQVLAAWIEPGNIASEGLARKAQFELTSSHGPCLIYERHA